MKHSPMHISDRIVLRSCAIAFAVLLVLHFTGVLR